MSSPLYTVSPKASVFYTPASSKSNKYSIRDAESSYFYIPPATFTLDFDKPFIIDASTGEVYEPRNGVDLEWVSHSKQAKFTYYGVAFISIFYYAACFARQYGNHDYRPRDDWLDESWLTRVMMFLWLVIALLVLFGIFISRRIFMPIYVFVSINASIGTFVLFMVKFKQFIDGRIHYNDVPLNLLGIVLFFLLVQDIVYFYAMHLHFVQKNLPKIEPVREQYFKQIPILQV